MRERERERGGCDCENGRFVCFLLWLRCAASGEKKADAMVLFVVLAARLLLLLLLFCFVFVVFCLWFLGLLVIR